MGRTDPTLDTRREEHLREVKVCDAIHQSSYNRTPLQPTFPTDLLQQKPWITWSLASKHKYRGNRAFYQSRRRRLALLKTSKFWIAWGLKFVNFEANQRSDVGKHATRHQDSATVISILMVDIQAGSNFANFRHVPKRIMFFANYPTQNGWGIVAGPEVYPHLIAHVEWQKRK